ncbi:hypothetical protein SESBI_44567 [Sesbania bispinosa]|nr:hypothetical protein SESBI_44567 [Sesbania bispinosa]
MGGGGDSNKAQLRQRMKDLSWSSNSSSMNLGLYSRGSSLRCDCGFKAKVYT